MKAFFKTFLVVFLITLVLATPLMAAMNRVLDVNPGGDDVPVLEDELDVLIDPESPFFDAFSNSKRVNILALGVNENEGLTDTIMLVSFDTENKLLDLIWIPRDTYYYRGAGYSDRAHHKINAVYRKNPVNTAKAVSEILMDIPINYYVVLSYEGVANIVDSMKGVPMDIPFDMIYDDPLDTPPLHINLKKGEQVLNGAQAVQFLRYRAGYPDADLGRIKAQQQFMKNAFKQCLSLDLPKIVTTAFDEIKSDITLKVALALASKAIGITGEDIRIHTMPIRTVDYYVRPDVEGIMAMLTEIHMPAPVEEEAGQ